MTSIQAVARRLTAGSQSLVEQVERRLPLLMMLWVMAASAATGLRLAADAPAGPAPVPGSVVGGVVAALPYVLVVGAPIGTLMVALRLFPRDAARVQPRWRLARLGRWVALDAGAARGDAAFGAAGFMASLLIGILLNVPIRAGEFLAALPAIGASAPVWYRWLFGLMLGDLLLLACLYVVAFVMALRHIPLFPRFLALVWGIDIAMQIAIARVMAQVGSLPASVRAPLGDMLEGNLKKVLISMAIWLPYLLFSRRVNVTFRSRRPA